MAATTLQIPLHAHESVLKKARQIEKRAKRNNLEFSWTIGDTYMVAHPVIDNASVPVADFTFSQGTISVEGYRLIGSLDFKTVPGHVLVNGVPGCDVAIPTAYREHSGNCDHCNTKRSRKLVAVLVHEDTGEIVAIGRSCVRDYIGRDITAETTHLRNLIELTEMAEQCSDPEFSGSHPDHYEFSTVAVAAQAAACIRMDGFTSKAKSVEHFEETGDPLCTTSADVRSMFYVPDFRGNTNLQREYEEWKAERAPRDEDHATAKAAIEWVLVSEATSDYMHNLQAIAKGESVAFKMYAFWVSLVSTYQRAMEKTEKRNTEKAKINNEHVGEIGERMTVAVTVNRVSTFETQYGTTYVVGMLDADGHQLVWFGTSKLARTMGKGDTADLKVTVKKHDTYRDVAQTIITRAAKVAA